MYKQNLVANRGDNGRKAVAAQPDCMAREMCSGDFHAETNRV
jgi:hypothetical protein